MGGLRTLLVLCRTGLTEREGGRTALHPKKGTVPTPLWSKWCGIMDPLPSSVDA